MATTLEQFTAFGTDMVGLERLLRLLQSVLLIVTSYPSLLSRLARASVGGAAAASLVRLQSQLNLTRRTMRLFWFLGSFQASWALYASTSAPSVSAGEAWLDVLAHSAFGMFGLLESVTLPDLARAVPLWGPDVAARLDAEAQVLWFVALCAAALRSGSRLYRVLACRTDDGAVRQRQGKTAEKKPREQRKARVADEDGATARALSMKLLAELLDLVIPAFAMGWITVHVGLVGVAMLCSTVLTSMAVWQRCRQQLQKAAS